MTRDRLIMVAEIALPILAELAAIGLFISMLAVFAAIGSGA